MSVKTLSKDVSPEHAQDVQMETDKMKITTWTVEKIETQLSFWEKRAKLDCEDNNCIPLIGCFEIICRREDLDENMMPAHLNMKQVTDDHRRKQRQFIELLHHCKRNELLTVVSTDIKGEEFTIGYRINRLIQLYSDAHDQVVLYNRQSIRINEKRCENDENMYCCSTMYGDDDDEKTPFQSLLLYLLSTLDKMEMRRYKGQCCQQIVTEDGHRTRAWKPVCQISDFVYENTQKETKYDMWKNITSKGTIVKDTIRHLSDCIDVQFPNIKKERTVWSFNNGIFVGRYWDGSRYTHKFMPYDSEELRTLDPTVISCKYFDQQFVDWSHENWYDIPTPHFQSVLDYQKFPEDVCKWMYVMGGRLMYDVGDLDQWQVIPFLKGIARSGKSTLITKVFKKFYETEDVKTLSNNIERKFGLSSIYDAFMFISPEVKGDLCLEQAEFQSMVSGEDISIARKNEKAISVTWTTPGILAGNEIPNWRDNSGSVLRRLLTFNFGKQVQDADPKLEEKLNEELPAIMCKCVRAYLEYAQKYSDKDIWQVVPDYFKVIQNQVAMVTNSLQHFLSSEKVKFGESLCCPQKLFVQMFNQHCIENNLGKFKFNPDFYAGPFSSRDITVRNDSMTYNGRAYASQPFVFGVDLVQDTVEFSDDY